MQVKFVFNKSGQLVAAFPASLFDINEGQVNNEHSFSAVEVKAIDGGRIIDADLTGQIKGEQDITQFVNRHDIKLVRGRTLKYTVKSEK